jgi:large repetitive protein
MWAVPTLQDLAANPLDLLIPSSIPRPLITSQSQWRALETWQVTIDQLESLTSLNFWSSVPITIQNDIEEILIPLISPVRVPPSPIESGEIDPDSEGEGTDLRAPFLADTNTSPELIIYSRFDNNSSIGKSCVVEESSFPETPIHISSSQISFSKISSGQVSSGQVSLSQISSSKIGVSTVDNTQTSLSQIGFGQIGFDQTSTRQVNIGQVFTSEVDLSQISSTKIPLSSSITLQQFLSSHNFDLQNKTVPLWTEFLQSPTPFNLKVEITDLPTGQLAEGTITGYDSNGRPNSGTLTIDSTGNGQGWFIDTTPGDNSEFDQQLTETAYRATSGAAAGKYDLLTAILHELGHLQGIIQGNSEFDRNIKNGKFITDTITAQLTPDGSHLDSTLYPYDLLNTSLKPGIRKLPSQLDLAIINQLYSHPASQNKPPQNPNAALTAGALFAIENGDFTTTTGWNLQGGTTISNGAATLSEAS